jgi:hypothetical protein
MLIPRDAEPLLRRLAGEYPVVAITGPRQSGKTTLARQVFDDRPYRNLERPDLRQFASEDPRGFLAELPEGGLIDEVQRVPELLSWLQDAVDADPRPGRFVLTGSQQFGLRQGLSQSLAGRVALLELLPFSACELARGGCLPDSLDELLLKGAYPPVHDRGLEGPRWSGNYVATYLERDVRNLVNVRDLTTFQRFLQLCAGRSGQLLNLSGLGADAGISHPTVREWLSVLEASYVIQRLPPAHRNLSKRLVKSPKLHLLDTGLACWLLGISTAEQLRSHPLRGALFESWVAAEVRKWRDNHGLNWRLGFWRDRSGQELDLVLEAADRAVGVEVKSGATITADQLRPLQRWLALDPGARGVVIHGGREPQRRSDLTVLPWRHLARADAWEEELRPA